MASRLDELLLVVTRSGRNSLRVLVPGAAIGGIFEKQDGSYIEMRHAQAANGDPAGFDVREDWEQIRDGLQAQLRDEDEEEPADARGSFDPPVRPTLEELCGPENEPPAQDEPPESAA